MKKLLFAALLASATLFTACTTEDTDNTSVNEKISQSYTGTLYVSEATTQESTYTQDDTTFSFEAANGVGELTMTAVKFTSSTYAPQLTIVASDIPATSSGVYEIESVIPTIGGDEYPTYTLTDIKIEVSESSIKVSFDCSSSSIEFAGE